MHVQWIKCLSSKNACSVPYTLVTWISILFECNRQRVWCLRRKFFHRYHSKIIELIDKSSHYLWEKRSEQKTTMNHFCYGSNCICGATDNVSIHINIIRIFSMQLKWYSGLTTASHSNSWQFNSCLKYILYFLILFFQWLNWE